MKHLKFTQREIIDAEYSIVIDDAEYEKVSNMTGEEVEDFIANGDWNSHRESYVEGVGLVGDIELDDGPTWEASSLDEWRG